MQIVRLLCLDVCLRPLPDVGFWVVECTMQRAVVVQYLAKRSCDVHEKGGCGAFFEVVVIIDSWAGS